MLAELVVIGKVVGRWQSRMANERERREVPATLEEVVSCAPWQLIDHAGRSFNVAAEWLRKKTEYPPLASIRKRAWIDRLMPPSFIKLTCPIKYSDKEVKAFLQPGPDGSPEFTLQQVEQIAAQLTVDDLSGLLLNIVVAANIARPNTLRFDNVFKFINGTFYQKSKPVGAYISEVIDEAERRGWPTFENLTLPRVVSWLNQIPGFKQRHSETALGRAVAAAGYLMMSQSPGDSANLDLVWALLGLEALYAKGNVGLQQQLMDKTEAFLGPRTSHKKEFAAMYQFRSRFLHGDIDFVFANNEYTATERYDKFRDALQSSEDIAIALLFATLQRMCAENRFELGFKYVVPPGSSVPEETQH